MTDFSQWQWSEEETECVACTRDSLIKQLVCGWEVEENETTDSLPLTHVTSPSYDTDAESGYESSIPVEKKSIPWQEALALLGQSEAASQHTQKCRLHTFDTWLGPAFWHRTSSKGGLSLPSHTSSVQVM